MAQRHYHIFAATILGVVAAVTATAQAEPAKDTPAAVADGKTYTLQRRPFAVRVKLDGVLESTDMHEVRLVPDEWSSWTVDRAVAHGTKVRKGDPILWFNRRELVQKLADLAAGRELTQLELKQAREELALLKKSMPMELAKVRRSTEIAEEDMARFAKIEKPAAVRSSEFSLESAENYLAYEREELKQLERMYKADDLTDETEEIILRRARDSVKRAEQSLLKAKEQHQETIAVELPRKEIDQQQAVQAAKLAMVGAEVDLPLKLSKARLSVEKLEYDHRKADVEWKRLKQDSERLTLHAPADGIVYYGHCENGQWSSAATVAKMLRPGGTVTPHIVLMTIVNRNRLVVRCNVPQKDLGAIKVNAPTEVHVVGFEKAPLFAKVRSVSTLAGPDGEFSCIIESDRLTKGDLPKLPPLMPGMKCQVEVVAFAKRDALVAPKTTLHEEPQWHGVHYVYRVAEDGNVEKYWVEVQHSDDQFAEIAAASDARPAFPWSATRGARVEPPWHKQDASKLRAGATILLKKPSGADEGAM